MLSGNQNHAGEWVQWEHPAPRVPQVEADGGILVEVAVTPSASPASQREQGSSWRVDPDKAKGLLGFHECFVCSGNPFGNWGEAMGWSLAMSWQEGR